ncbi:hypothetical protein [Bradyrhizobium manausense]|uniref:hypothetical protein n=1 Tax=Bradyrhizobium manausense TaxID=989370 RepID=UPI0020115D66|nr:hypothetical protein [Bradyrhizobium manausense]
MNESANTSCPALMEDEQADLPEHFDWSALALPRSKLIPASATSAGNISSEHHAASGDDRVSPQTPPAIVEAGRQPDLPAPETSTVISQEPLAVAKRFHPPLPLPKHRILRLRFSDVGEPREPGEHRSHYGPVEITRHDLAVWKAFPNAIFTVIQPSPYSNATISRLGTFEV